MKVAERYAVTVRRVEIEGEELWRATVAELPDLAEFAETREEAIELALEAIEELKSAAEAEGRQFPEPNTEEEEYTGRITLRLPKTVHRLIACQALEEEVSINAYVSSVLTLSLKTHAANLTPQTSAPVSGPLQVIAAASFLPNGQRWQATEPSTAISNNAVRLLDPAAPTTLQLPASNVIQIIPRRSARHGN